MGQTLFVPMPRGEAAATVASPIFYDPDGGRMNG